MKRKYIRNGLHKIAYHQYKGIGNHLLILVHGLGADAKCWDNQIEHLNSLGYDIITYDLRGHGKSSFSKSIEYYGFEHQIQDLNRLVLKFRKKMKCTLIGHCFGAAITMSYISQYKENVDNVILMSSPFENRRPFARRILRGAVKVMNIANLEPLPPRKKQRKYSIFKGSADWCVKRNIHAMRQTGFLNYLSTLQEFLDFNATSLLKNVDIPAAVIVGENDTVFSPHQSYDIYNSIPQATFHVIKNANHLLTLNNCEETNAMLNEVLMKFDTEEENEMAILEQSDNVWFHHYPNQHPFID